MNKSDEFRRYKWSTLATNLLVSIWCHDLVQNQLRVTSRIQPIWESIARYMTRKGYPVTGMQCRTRIKNMLCSYNEAVRKNDPSIIEPYYDTFKNVLSNKVLKKSDVKMARTRQERAADDICPEKEINLNASSYEIKQCDTVNTNSEYKMEFSDVGNNESEASGAPSESELMKDAENVIIKAIDSQTKAIISAIKMQSQMIEKLVLAERLKWETLMDSERESRKQLENRLDTLLAKLETNFLPQTMGNIFGTRTMAEEFKRNQEFITEMNKIKTERHIQMQNQIREREMALRIAKDREFVLWLGAFYLVSVPYLYVAWKNTGKSKYLGPIIPLSFVLAYQIDKGYGNKLDRIRQEAEMIMQFSPEILELPCGVPTASSIDQARLEADERKKLHPALPAL